MQNLVMHGLMGFAGDCDLMSGNVDSTLEAALRATHSRPPESGGALHEGQGVDPLQWAAQLLLLLNRPEDAADYFDRCLKQLPRSARTDMQARSCLISGLQSLCRNQLRTAWNCLQRTTGEKHASLHVQVAACGAMAALFFRLGMRRPAQAAVDRALALLDTDSQANETPRAVLAVLQAEFMVLDLLRRHPRLDDLAFWPRNEEVAGQRVGLPQALELLTECRALIGPRPLLQNRLEFLGTLLRIAYQGSAMSEGAHNHIRQATGQGMASYAIEARQELALAFIAAEQGDNLRRLMNVSSAASVNTAAGAGYSRGGEHLNFEHDYCLAKLGELSGRADAYITHYRIYATQALMQVRRACAYVEVPSSIKQASNDIPKDEIASRLPARYRRAYQFILANLHRADLSIKHVADNLGVTDRALQMAFRAHLGMSPSAVIRQCRMDRIHTDLASGSATRGTTTLDVAQRWGVRSRSALAHSYRGAFGELPSQTAAALGA
jgi:AraC-like DNA-binding protein